MKSVCSTPCSSACPAAKAFISPCHQLPGRHTLSKGKGPSVERDNKWRRGPVSLNVPRLPDRLRGSAGCLLVEAIFDQEIGPEIYLAVLEEPSWCLPLAATRPFNVVCKPGLAQTDNGALIFLIWRIAAASNNEVIREQFLNPNNIDAIRTLSTASRQTHLKVLIINSRTDEVVDWFEFENVFQFDRLLNSAVEMVGRLPAGDFSDAIEEFTRQNSLEDLLGSPTGLERKAPTPPDAAGGAQAGWEDLMEPWEKPNARVDYLVIMGSREEVEAGDVSKVSASLKKLLTPENGKRLKGRLVFGIGGYDADPRELFEIREVRTWMHALDREFPYWFYFMDLGPRSTLSFVTFSLCRYEKVPGGKMVDRDDLLMFVTTHFSAMNQLAVSLGITEEEINDRSGAISEFFFPEDE
jgi:hypothetical protein